MMSAWVALHYQKENETMHQLLKLENNFREHYGLTLREMQTQKELIDRLWVLSQRYQQILSTGPCCKYPEIYTTPSEDIILHEYHEKLQMLRASCCRINKSLYDLRKGVLVFQKLSVQLDRSIESPFMLGDAFHKPIGFFVELVDDLFKYFHAQILKLKYRSHQLEPAESVSLEEYRTQLEPSEDFEEYLMMGLTYCKCLRPKEKCCVKVYPKPDKLEC